MNFRTEIGKIAGSFHICHDDKIVLVGSCFADNIGALLERDGFDVVHNPLGPLFNPMSIENVLGRRGKPFGTEDFVCIDGEWHCLWWANRFRASTAERLAAMVNELYLPFHKALEEAYVIILTFGTTRIFTYGDKGTVAGNCHKINPSFFEERNIEADETSKLILAGHYPQARCIFTLSPVRYPGQGLPAAFLAKATLRVAIDKITAKHGYDYFPSFEIVNDDLRDYRFYAADMRHPSDVAVDYIYSKFAETYFTSETMHTAEEFRRKARRAAHIPFNNGL